ASATEPRRAPVEASWAIDALQRRNKSPRKDGKKAIERQQQLRSRCAMDASKRRANSTSSNPDLGNSCSCYEIGTRKSAERMGVRGQALRFLAEPYGTLA